MLFRSDIRAITIEKGDSNNKLRVELKNGNVYHIQDNLIDGRFANRTLLRTNIKLTDKAPQLDIAKPQIPVDCSVESLTPCFANLTLTQQSKRNIELAKTVTKSRYHFITLDLETIIENMDNGDKGMKLLCASIFNHSQAKSWYLADYIHNYYPKVRDGLQIDYDTAKSALISDLFKYLFEVRVACRKGQMQIGIAHV